MPTRAYIPASAGTPGSGISISIGAVRVAGSRTGETRAMRPLNVSPGNASTSTRVSLPVSSSFRSFSTTLATSRTRVMSTTSATGRLLRHECAGIDVRLGDEAVHGRRDHRVRQVDAQLVEPRLRLRWSAHARDRAARALPDSALRCRPASASAAVDARTGCATARRWSLPAAGRLRADESSPSETSCAASACLTCSTISKSSILARR